MHAEREKVVIHPGLGSPAWSMSLLAARLRRQGFDTLIIPYSARRSSLSEVVSEVCGRMEELRPGPRFHMLGHSMGGLVARGVAERMRCASDIGRIVMVGTPLLGSTIAARLARLPVGGLPYGRLWHDLSPAGCAGNGSALEGVAIGMIAGSVPGGRLFGGAGTDGIVPVSATRSAGLADHLEVPASHALLLTSGKVAAAAGCFFRTGRLREAAT